jgi:hypothetical protein
MGQSYGKVLRIPKNVPTPNPTTNREILARASSSDILNSLPTPAISAVITLDEKATTKHVVATTICATSAKLELHSY